MKRAILCLFFCASVLFLPNLAKRTTNGFRLGKLALDLYYNPAWEAEGVDHELARGILRGPLRYLSHGAQSFVFATEDGEYIVKLFRYDQRVHPWRQWLRDCLFQKKKRLSHEKKIHRLFSAAKLAFEQARDLTGLVYVHLNQTDDLLPSVRLIDHLGRRYVLDLNRYRFAIQLRARPIREVFQEAIASKDPEKVERLIDSFAALLKKRTAMQIRNSDTKVAPNFGFCNETAIEWDFGNYWIDPTLQDPRVEMDHFTPHLRRFLAKTDPAYLAYYDRAVQ